MRFLNAIVWEAKNLSAKFLIGLLTLVWVLTGGELAVYVVLFLMIFKVGMLEEDKRRAKERVGQGF